MTGGTPELVMVRSGSYQTSLVFSSLDRGRGDEGNYTCTASVIQSGFTLSTAYATTTITIHSEFSEIRESHP